MKLHELAPAAGSTKEPKRKGRGTATGNGKTAGRGEKGQKARSGGACGRRHSRPHRTEDTFGAYGCTKCIKF